MGLVPSRDGADRELGEHQYFGQSAPASSQLRILVASRIFADASARFGFRPLLSWEHEDVLLFADRDQPVVNEPGRLRLQNSIFPE